PEGPSKKGKSIRYPISVPPQLSLTPLDYEQVILPTDLPAAAVSVPTTSTPKKKKGRTNAERKIYFCPIQGCTWAEGSDEMMPSIKNFLTSNHYRNHAKR